MYDQVVLKKIEFKAIKHCYTDNIDNLTYLLYYYLSYCWITIVNTISYKYRQLSSLTVV